MTVSNAIVLSNTMTKGAGGVGVFQHASPIKNVNGGFDYYTTIQNALDGVSFDNSKIVMHEDQVITAALIPPNYVIIVDGNHQFNITRSAGNPLMILGDNDKVKFVNIDLLGSIDVAGNSVELELADHTFLNGMIDVQSGDVNTQIKLDQCKIVGDASDNYCVRVASANPTIIIKRANLKANLLNPAIYWQVDNDKVKLAYASIIHGSVAGNNPFGRNGALNINYASHHNCYNSNPELDANFVNLITTNYDVADVNGDY